jgi:DNA-binding response OmpR family regulator
MYQILLTTADQSLVSMIQDALKASPISCVVANNVQVAARELQSNTRPDIVLLDLAIDHAVTFLQEMKRLKTFADLPVLAITDAPDSDQIKLALEAGADRWIVTGFIRTSLFNIIRQLASKEAEKS